MENYLSIMDIVEMDNVCYDMSKDIENFESLLFALEKKNPDKEKAYDELADTLAKAAQALVDAGNVLYNTREMIKADEYADLD